LPLAGPNILTNGDNSVSETDTVPATRGRTGVAIGILIVTLLALAFYFYWRATGMRDDGGRRPPPPREISSLALIEADRE
jgi:hypothetical protein